MLISLELTNMRKETTFGTCPPPGVGGPEVYPLLPWDCADESHWTEDLLQAVNTNNTLLKTDVAGGVPETLNTPTMEVKELTFPSSSFTIVPRDEEVPTSILSSDEELLGDMNIDVMDASSLPSTSSHTYTNNDFEFFPDNSTNIEDVWGSLGSPSMQAVSLLEIEGRSKEDTEVATFDAPVEVTKVETDDRDLLNWAMETSEVLNSVAAAPEDNKDNVFVTLDTSQLQLFADYRPRNYRLDKFHLSPSNNGLLKRVNSMFHPVPFKRCVSFLGQTDFQGLLRFYVMFSILCLVFTLVTRLTHALSVV